MILDNQKMEALSKSVRFSFWEKYDESHIVVRFATSWATKMEDVNALEALLKSYGNFLFSQALAACRSLFNPEKTLL